MPFSKTFLLAVMCVLCSTLALAASVTTATGGGAIDNSTAGSTFTNLTGPVITESASSDIGNGTIILNIPSGFEFDTTANVTVLVTKLGGGPASKQINNAAGGASLTVTSIT